MRHTFFIYFSLCQLSIGLAQQVPTISGMVVSHQSKEALSFVTLEIEGTPIVKLSNANGYFSLACTLRGDYILNISISDYTTQRIPIHLDGNAIALGIIYLERDITIEQQDNLITLTDAELQEDDLNSNSSGLLQATKDIFLARAAFDFGQAFFKVRGYDARNAKVLINGITMNKFYDGRPQWNNWGGLNDVTRNQKFTNGLSPSAYSFGAVLGVTHINTRPSGMRPGMRVSSSISNRTYGARLMATYTSKRKENGFTYSVSGSRRWAKQGYIDGTLYDAFSFFGALEYQFNTKNTVVFTGIWASNRRGSSAAMTEEVFDLVGQTYNPYWGNQEGAIRNARERKIEEPIFMLNYYFNAAHTKINTGISYQSGILLRSRLGYYNAPNPDPTYYRYLPSFYINSPIGANFLSANAAKEGFLKNPQLNWQQLYRANSREKAAYVLYDDITKDSQISANTTVNLKISEAFKLDVGAYFRKMKSHNYAQINDLLGASYHDDIDTFSNTLNDIHGAVQKRKNEIFNYNYNSNVEEMDAFMQMHYEQPKWSAFFAANYTSTKNIREGLFQNERFLEESFGKSKAIDFLNHGMKGGISYKINGRHWIGTNAALVYVPPVLQHLFINPRENNQIVPNIAAEKISTTDVSYTIRLPKLTGRFTGFYTRFQHTTDINFFFVDTGLGSDFVQEVLTDLDKLHMGTEIGLEYQMSPSLQLSAVAAIGKYVYANDPSVAINFDTAGAEENLINLEGNIDLGKAKIKDYKLAQGPQKAFSFGINYRDPHYWWVGMTGNYLANNYVNISTITRTDSFYINPETGMKFPEATNENVAKLLEQRPLESFYLLNVVGGKSWLKSGTYISFFASINNVFDAVFKTGGYEQSRNGNFGQLKQDNLSGTPSFAPKYWYGYGRTFFLNLAVSF